jgi:hypothetical protein
MMTFSDTKPATQSLAIWSAIAAILSGLSTLALVAAGQLGPDAVGSALLSIVGGIGAALIGWLAVMTTAAQGSREGIRELQDALRKGMADEDRPGH